MTVDHAVKTLSILGAVVTFAWGVFQYVEDHKKQAETRRIEATKPFSDRQLKLYTEATQSAAILATTEDPSERVAAIKRFWSLYWGELALVSDCSARAHRSTSCECGQAHVSVAMARQNRSSLGGTAHICGFLLLCRLTYGH
jgi:hypothetical protein